ncbi:hypothetical protein SLEP1_g36837 [Rubroshorea leprosula]|uniref:Uncharacterized protein n=1 Tax=Rubroshorea leprosula TaxID=152421 RepID=A0AAV5KST9_9ROSI|nr:hypothetical protein SLEP1_g36837 [Rubroshorea leprosula]
MTKVMENIHYFQECVERIMVVLIVLSLFSTICHFQKSILTMSSAFSF